MLDYWQCEIRLKKPIEYDSSLEAELEDESNQEFVENFAIKKVWQSFGGDPSEFGKYLGGSNLDEFQDKWEARCKRIIRD